VLLCFLITSLSLASVRLSYFFFQCYVDHRDLHSFPTRRSSDLLVVCVLADRLEFFEGDRLDLFDGHLFDLHLGFERLFLQLNRRSEEHTSELQSRENLVCRLLLEKKKKM